jgi:hypothetical protein
VTRSAPIARALLLAAIAALVGACSARPLHRDSDGGAGGSGLTGAGGGTFTPTRKVDMLFVIDDSAETTRLQTTFLANFPTFLTALRSLPGDPPDMHIAVVSSDLGAGDGSIAPCNATGGDKAIFQHTARGTCTSTGLAPGATFIADNGEVTNYTGNLVDVFACIAALGESGCGFEHQLAAAASARHGTVARDDALVQGVRPVLGRSRRPHVPVGERLRLQQTVPFGLRRELRTIAGPARAAPLPGALKSISAAPVI